MEWMRHCDQAVARKAPPIFDAPSGPELAYRLHPRWQQTEGEFVLPPFRMPVAREETSRTRARDLARPDLSIVMHVYNEGSVIAEVVTAWIQELERLGIDYEFRAYDDGSVDETGRMLERLAGAQHGMVVTRKASSGHGPTILRGYREAFGEWIFQVDGDAEMGPEHFEELWKQRDDYDLLIGRRQHRDSALTRRFITVGSRATVWALFGRAVTDVNAPYRLIRRSALAAMLSMIPDDTFAPNVVISGLAARKGLRVREIWVGHRDRTTGTVSVVKSQLWRAAPRAFVQTLGIAIRARSTR
jgi:glycosyltransferase involved in cell wall biosynthesis